MERGFCGIGVYHSKNKDNIGTLWRSAYCFGVDFIFTVGKRYERQITDTVKAPRHIPLFHFKDTRDLKEHLPLGCRLIGVEIVEGSKGLPTYTHPSTACYLLGAEDAGLSKEALAACHAVVEIPGTVRCLNVASAGSIVLYDRKVKGTVG